MYEQSFIEVGKHRPLEKKGRVAIYQQQGLPEFRNQPLLFTHATGFHARCWDEVVRQFPERRIILLDTRCHGLSSNLEPPFSWDDFTQDLLEVIEALNLNNIFGVGHSMGGHLQIRAAGHEPSRFAQILAIDPVIFSADMPRMRELIPEGMEHPVAKRRNNWASSDEMFENYRHKKPFSLWNEQVLRDYCDYALGEDGLNCPPRLEANIYFTPDSDGAYQVIPNINFPVHIVRARSRNSEDAPFSFEPSPTIPELYKYFKNATDLQFQEYSHFIPMENPYKVAELIRQYFFSGA